MLMRHLILLAITLSAVAISAHASTGHIPGGPRIADCSKARDPAQCEARLAARTACQHKRGSEKKQCMDARSVTPECIGNANPVRCSQQQRAAHICREKKGKAYKQCVSTETKKFSSRL